MSRIGPAMSDVQRLIRQVDDLAEDRVARNARIRDLEAEVERLAMRMEKIRVLAESKLTCLSEFERLSEIALLAADEGERKGA